MMMMWNRTSKWRLTVSGCVLAAVVLWGCASAQKAPVNQGRCYRPARLVVRNHTGFSVDIYTAGWRFIGTAHPGTSSFPLGPDDKGGFSFHVDRGSGEQSYVIGRGITYEIQCSNAK